MTHFFATMIRESYDIRATKPEQWYDPKTKSGKLKDYLLDPGNIFSDRSFGFKFIPRAKKNALFHQQIIQVHHDVGS